MSAQSSLDKYIKGRRQNNSVQLYRILKGKGKSKALVVSSQTPNCRKNLQTNAGKKFLSIPQKQLYIYTQNNKTQSRSAMPKLEIIILSCSTKLEPVAYSVSNPTAIPNIAHLNPQSKTPQSQL
jgi:hypothetical protein